MTRDDRTPAFGLRPPVQVAALPDDHPRVREQVARIAALSTPIRELNGDGSFRAWIRGDAERFAPENSGPFVRGAA